MDIGAEYVGISTVLDAVPKREFGLRDLRVRCV